MMMTPTTATGTINNLPMVNEQDEEKDTNTNNEANTNTDRGGSNNGNQGTMKTTGTMTMNGMTGTMMKMQKCETMPGPENQG